MDTALGVIVCIATILLLALQPNMSADLTAYLHIIATCQAEYNFSSCPAYDVASRRSTTIVGFTLGIYVYTRNIPTPAQPHDMKIAY